MADYLENDLLDYAILIGMTPEQYWKDNPMLITNYQKAYETKQKLIEQQIWLMAQYNRCAFSSSVLNVASITDYKHYKIPEMPKCPYVDEMKSKQPMTEQQIENERLRAYAFFKNLKVPKKEK